MSAQRVMKLSHIQPVVLAGGASRRFGSDKLRAHLPDGSLLIDRPIGALRAVFGKRVAVVGNCAAEVAARGDLHWPDEVFSAVKRGAGAGPMGGIVTALTRAGGDVFVLAGDLVNVTEETVRRILNAADETSTADSPSADGGTLAILGETDRLETCAGVYRHESLAILRERVERGELSLHDALPAERVVRVKIDAEELRNVNARDDLD